MPANKLAGSSLEATVQWAPIPAAEAIPAVSGFHFCPSKIFSRWKLYSITVNYCPCIETRKRSRVEQQGLKRRGGEEAKEGKLNACFFPLARFHKGRFPQPEAGSDDSDNRANRRDGRVQCNRHPETTWGRDMIFFERQHCRPTSLSACLHRWELRNLPLPQEQKYTLSRRAEPPYSFLCVIGGPPQEVQVKNLHPERKERLILEEER